MHYVVGFMFDLEMTNVVLIRKQKPEWQRDKLNGVGGKVEPDEIGREAMAREFTEETGLKTWPENWLPVVRMTNGGEGEYIVLDVFAMGSNDWRRVCTVTMETVVTYPFWEAIAREDALDNLQWLIPLCRAALKKGELWNRLDMPGSIS